MKRKRYSVEQIVAAVKQHDMGLPTETLPASWGLRSRHSIAGRSSMATWMPPRCGNSRNCGRRMPNSRSWWRNSAWTRRCCRRLRQKSGERTRAPGCGALSLRAVWDQRTACVSGGAGVPGSRAVPSPAAVPTGPAAMHSRLGREPRPLWVQTDPCFVEAGGAPGEPQAGHRLYCLEGLQLRARRPSRPVSAAKRPERGLEYGLCDGSHRCGPPVLDAGRDLGVYA